MLCVRLDDLCAYKVATRKTEYQNLFFLPNNVKLEKFAFLYSLRLLVVSGVGFSSHNGRFDVKTSLGGFPDAVATRLCFLSPLSYTICIALVISILINERSRSLVKNIYNLFFCNFLYSRSTFLNLLHCGEEKFCG